MGNENPYRLFALYSSIIFILPAALLGGYWLGKWADVFLGSSPWLTYAGLLLGGAAGFKQLFQLLNRAAPKDRRRGNQTKGKEL